MALGVASLITFLTERNKITDFIPDAYPHLWECCPVPVTNGDHHERRDQGRGRCHAEGAMHPAKNRSLRRAPKIARRRARREGISGAGEIAQA